MERKSGHQSHDKAPKAESVDLTSLLSTPSFPWDLSESEEYDSTWTSDVSELDFSTSESLSESVATTTSDSGLQTLSHLPPELLLIILAETRSIIDVFRARRISRVMKQVVDFARLPFWKHLYLVTWQTGPLYNLRVDSSGFTDKSIGFPGKYRSATSTQLDPSVRRLDSVQPPVDPKTFSWKLFCRHHCFNRLEFCPGPTLFSPVMTLKLGGLSVKYSEYTAGAVRPYPYYRSVRAQLPLRPLFAKKKIGYFEVTVVLSHEDEDKTVTFGVATANFPWEKCAIGWESDALSVGFHADDGRKFSPSDNPTYGVASWNNSLPVGKSTIGCGINFQTNDIFFTRDGIFLGIAYTFNPDNVKQTSTESIKLLNEDGWRPFVSASSCPVEISFNFGQQKFAFELAGCSIMWDRFGSGPTQSMAYLADLFDENAPIPFENM